MAESIAAGGLEFRVEFRGEPTDTDKDRGPSMQVLTTVDGNKVQLLRFDMFYGDPHYHYGPMGQNRGKYSLDPVFVDDGISWAIDAVSKKLPQLITRAGFESLAGQVSSAEVAKALPSIEARWRAQTAATPK